jgi:hydrogenase 3 maturation protease
MRVAVVGIGNELSGDDAAGIAVARALGSKIRNHPVAPSFCIIEAGMAPENFTGTLRRFRPDLVVLVDAAQMDQAPGTVRWFDAESAAGFSASTHTLPLNLFALYLQSEIGCEVKLLGIQPAHSSTRSFDLERSLHLSAPVQKATREVVLETARILTSLTKFGQSKHRVLTLEP